MRWGAMLMCAAALLPLAAAPHALADDTELCRISDKRLTEISGLA